MKPINYILVSEIGSEILTLSDIKIHLRLDGSDYDSILTPLIRTSREIGEKITGRDFIEKEWKTYLDAFPVSSCEGIELRKSKLKSITSIQYYDENNVLQTLSASDYYITEEADYSSIFLKCDKSFPRTYCRKQAVIILHPELVSCTYKPLYYLHYNYNQKYCQPFREKDVAIYIGG